MSQMELQQGIAKQGDAVSDNVVEIDDVHYSINGRAIFSGLSLNIRRGRITAIMGPSGTGKTTLLRLMTGQIQPSKGRVIVEGRDVATLNRIELFAMRQRMGMLFQNGALLTDMSVFDNVAFPLREHTDLPEELIATVVLAKLQAVGLRGAYELMPTELSGGMARRVALARAIATDPAMLIYDEPFAGLDPISMGVILRLIRQMNDTLQLTSLVVSHDVDEIALLADISYILAGGKVVASGETKALKNSDVELVRQFMNGLADGPVPFHYPASDYREHLLAGVVSKATLKTMTMLKDLFSNAQNFVANMGAVALFFFRILMQIPRALLRPGLIIRQVHNAGGLSLVIIMTSALVVGMAMGLQLYDVLARFGSAESLGTGAGLALLKELGPVLTALLFSGRAGTALASEIGLMKATDQLAAMEMMAVDSVRYVIAPRFLGGVIAMPLLTAVFVMIALFGVQLVGVQQLHVDQGTFWSQLRGSVDWHDVRQCLIKGFAFGTACSLIAVFEGFRAEPTAEGVGRATTRAVVNSAVLILILDYMITAALL